MLVIQKFKSDLLSWKDNESLNQDWMISEDFFGSDLLRLLAFVCVIPSLILLVNII